MQEFQKDLQFNFFSTSLIISRASSSANKIPFVPFKITISFFIVNKSGLAFLIN